MKDFVSNHWISLVALVVSMSIICTVLVHYGYPGTALVGVGLALSTVFILTLRSSRPIGQVIKSEGTP
jgi:hypothetical protein